MSIIVTGRKMDVTDALRLYAEEKIGHSLNVMSISPLDAEVVLSVKKNPSIANSCKCEVTIRTKGHVIHVEESEIDMYAAIDIAAAKVLRQLRKFKNKVVKRKKHAKTGDAPNSLREINKMNQDLDFDALMNDLASEDEIVRVKKINFEPLTEEEALIKIDLLGHDFFAYTDRDTDAFCVLYRRSDNSYGLLQQA